jgi:hypothetical protein
MENNNMILSDKTVSKEYQIPELIDLNSVNEAMGGDPSSCGGGSGATTSCGGGGGI